MKKTKTILAATVAAFAVCGMAKADSEYNVDGFTVLANNWQYNWSTVFARAVFSGFNIAGDFKASTVSIGNNWISETDGSTRILNQQTQLADLGSTTKGPLTNVGGNVDLSAATICNNASMTTGKSGKVSIDNVQKCNTTDPFAVVGLAGRWLHEQAHCPAQGLHRRSHDARQVTSRSTRRRPCCARSMGKHAGTRGGASRRALEPKTC